MKGIQFKWAADPTGKICQKVYLCNPVKQADSVSSSIWHFLRRKLCLCSWGGVWGGCIAVTLQIRSTSVSREAIAHSYRWQERKEWYHEEAIRLLTDIVVSHLQHHTKALLGVNVRNYAAQPYLCRASWGNQFGERIIHILQVCICSS